MDCTPQDMPEKIDTAIVIVFAPTLKSKTLGNLLTKAKNKVYIGVESKEFNKAQLLVFDKVVLLKDYRDYDKLKEVVMAHMTEPDLTRIAITEYRAIAAAARLRAELGIPGPRIDELAKFIDKETMKAKAIEGGVRVPKFTVFDRERYANNAEEYTDSLETALGYPMFIRPTCDTASQNTFKASSRFELLSVLAEINKLGNKFEIDEYIEGVLFSLQAVVVSNRLQFFRCGRYSSPSHKFSPEIPYGLIYDSPGSDLYTMMFDYLSRIMTVYTPWQDNVLFCQCYLTKNKEIVLIEVENRRSGNMNSQTLELQCGINTETVGIDLQLGSPVRLPHYDPLAPYDQHGAWMTYKTQGKIQEKNALPKNVTSRVHVQWLYNNGTVLNLANSSSSHSATVILINDDFEVLQKDFEAFQKWTPYLTEPE